MGTKYNEVFLEIELFDSLKNVEQNNIESNIFITFVNCLLEM